MSFKDVRKDFPMLQKTVHGKPLIYLDSAATAQKPQAVIDAISDFYQNRYGTVHRAVYELSLYATTEYQNVREKVRNFINAPSADEIIFTRGTTESINLIAYSFGKAFVKPGDEILISGMEHHSNIIPWQILCEDRQAILKVIPLDKNGDIDLEEYKKLLTKRTKLVAVTHISNAIGTLNPIKEMSSLAHQHGIPVLVDGAQAAPHLPIDVQDLDADFYVFSGHKLFGPTGIGVLYGKREYLDEMPPYQGGGDMIETVSFHQATYNRLPFKFEAGTPMIAEVLGLGAAIEYLNSIGLEKIQAYERTLFAYLTQLLSEIPEIQIIGTPRNKGSIHSFTIEGVHPLDLGTLLDLQGVAVRTGHHCSQPTMNHFKVSSTARISIAFYNTFEEIERACNIIKEIIGSFKCPCP